MNRLLLFFICLILAGCGKLKEEKKTLAEVETLVKFREYSKAILVLKEALKENPKSKALLRYRIIILLKAEQSDLAYAAYRQFKEKASPNDDVLLKALENEDATVRATAAQVLSVAKEADSVKALIKKVKDSDETVRRAAINALRELKDSSATSVLIEALKDESWFVRAEAAQALGSIGVEKALPNLFQVLNDHDDYVRQAASSALMSLANSNTHAIFVDKLFDSKEGVRLVAALALAKLHDNRGVNLLLDQLKNDSQDDRNKRLIIEALAQLKETAAIPFLQKQVLDEKADIQVRLTAIAALGLMPDDKSSSSTLHLLEDLSANTKNPVAIRQQAREAKELLQVALKNR